MIQKTAVSCVNAAEEIADKGFIHCVCVEKKMKCINAGEIHHGVVVTLYCKKAKRPVPIEKTKSCTHTRLVLC